MQLDIFNDSHDVMLRNDVLAALEGYDAAAAQAAWERLGAEYPDDEALAPLALLIEALPTSDEPLVPVADHDELARAHRRLHDLVEPTALRMFEPPTGRRWLVPLWRSLAGRAQALPYNPDFSQEHAAVLLLHALDWAAAIEAVRRIESWRRKPAPLAWMAEARFHVDGLEAASGLLAELAWLSTPRFDRLAERIDDPRLARLLERFDARFEVDAAGRAWFPAWLLTEDAKLAGWLERAERGLDSAPERAMRTLLELLRLERQARQRDVIERRRTLRDLNEGLFTAYMKTR